MDTSVAVKVEPARDMETLVSTVTSARDAKTPAVTPEACRAGRALMGWSMRDLALRCGVSLGAVHRLEAGLASPRAGTAMRIRRGFEACGVELVLNEGWTGAVLVYARRGSAL